MQVREVDAGGEGHVSTFVFKSDADPNVHFVPTVFESRARYKRFEGDRAPPVRLFGISSRAVVRAARDRLPGG